MTPKQTLLSPAPVRLFLCHANEDQPRVEAVYDRLTALGYKPWMDKRDLKGGQPWRVVIPQKLRAADLVLVFLSKISVTKKGYVQREFKLALDVIQELPDDSVFVIPVRLESCDVPERFRDFHWIDFFEDRDFSKIIDAIKAWEENRRAISSTPEIDSKTATEPPSESTTSWVAEQAGEPDPDLSTTKENTSSSFLTRRQIIGGAILTTAAALATRGALHFAERTTDQTPSVIGFKPPEVHLPPKGRRDMSNGRAFPLLEPDLPFREASASYAQKTSQLLRIIDWLRVDVSIRYQPANNTAYPNIYAYDYCYLARTYFPRVWWTRSALEDLASGATVANVVIGATVLEINANSAFSWFIEFSELFAWERVMDITDLQDAANEGETCLIVAQRSDLSRPGHISIVVPESPEHVAQRDRNGIVLKPLQSHAGAINSRFSTPENWWLSAKFKKYGFWRHA
jgi:hypothetical protein